MPPIISGNLPSGIGNATPDFSTLPSDLQGIAISQGILLPTYMFDAMAEVLTAFDTIQNNGRTPLYTWEFIDIIKKAEDAFNPGNIAKLKARIPGMQDYEIDVFISRSELITIFRSYQKWIMGVESFDQALTAQFAVYFLQSAMQTLITSKIALKGVWGGIRTATQSDRGADKSFKGMLAVLAEGAGVGGDIPTGNIFANTDPLDATHAYAEIMGVCQKAYANEDMLGVPMNVYLSPQAYTNYNKNRHTLAPDSVKLGEMITKPDYMPNLTFVEQQGLAVEPDKIIITPFSNFKFSVNTSPDHWNFEFEKVMKGNKLNILASGGVDYGYGPAIFMNDI